MRKIKDIISVKFKNIKTPNSVVVEEAERAIKEVLGIDIPNNYYKIVFNKPYLTISSSVSVLKNEIFINREKIVEKIKNKINKNTPIKILLK